MLAWAVAGWDSVGWDDGYLIGRLAVQTAGSGSIWGREFNVKWRRWIVLLALVLAVGVQGCVGSRTVRGSGKAAEEMREVSSFTGVELATIGNLYIELGEKEELRIEADDNLLQYFETRVRDGTLEIGDRDRVTLLPREPVRFSLTVKELDTIVLSGLGSIEVPDDIETTRLSLRMSGGGKVEVEDLRADVLEVNISGLGDLYVGEGEVEDQKVVISGGGSYRARELGSAKTQVRVTGLGFATVRVRDHLKVVISGGGSVKYIGNPTVEQDVSGVGHVERIGE